MPQHRHHSRASDSDSGSDSKPTLTGIQIGILTGGIALSLLAILATLYAILRRRQRLNQRDPGISARSGPSGPGGVSSRSIGPGSDGNNAAGDAGGGILPRSTGSGIRRHPGPSVRAYRDDIPFPRNWLDEPGRGGMREPELGLEIERYRTLQEEEDRRPQQQQQGQGQISPLSETSFPNPTLHPTPPPPDAHGATTPTISDIYARQLGYGLYHIGGEAESYFADHPLLQNPTTEREERGVGYGRGREGEAR